ncbi:hypothetical protein [Plantactinospora sp. CA-290183]|uniref:hypothetical protein n=1 Tax=Plantactinospora sp. CA-290183 TaxID=3240006 RepID=UPI003D91BF01
MTAVSAVRQPRGPVPPAPAGVRCALLVRIALLGGVALVGYLLLALLDDPARADDGRDGRPALLGSTPDVSPRSAGSTLARLTSTAAEQRPAGQRPRSAPSRDRVALVDAAPDRRSAGPPRRVRPAPAGDAPGGSRSAEVAPRPPGSAAVEPGRRPQPRLPRSVAAERDRPPVGIQTVTGPAPLRRAVVPPARVLGHLAEAVPVAADRVRLVADPVLLGGLAVAARPAWVVVRAVQAVPEIPGRAPLGPALPVAARGSPPEPLALPPPGEVQPGPGLPSGYRSIAGSPARPVAAPPSSTARMGSVQHSAAVRATARGAGAPTPYGPFSPARSGPGEQRAGAVTGAGAQPAALPAGAGWQPGARSRPTALLVDTIGAGRSPGVPTLPG